MVSLADAAKEDYFADALAEDGICALGRFSDFVVRSRNAVFSHKRKNPRPDVGFLNGVMKGWTVDPEAIITIYCRIQFQYAQL